MAKEFKIQIPQDIVRNPEINSKSFVLLAKLIQQYYRQKSDERNLTFTIKNYKMLLNFTNITDRRTFSDCLRILNEKGLIKSIVKPLPRNGELTVGLSPEVIPELNKDKEQVFTQFEYWILNMSVIEEIGHTGVRIMYYIMSWINYKKVGKDHCYASVVRMSKDLGIAEKTFIQYIKQLEKLKFISVKRFDNYSSYKDDKNGNENLLLDRWNNHYFLEQKNIRKFVDLEGK
ncbi:RepB family plasmid replication initiator protein [Peribacillus simplex]|uniref:Initiator Rep protein WH1 domain-containing protein n=1 Tax=Peribacillus simplex TaxID=1478 RepID=A0AAN2TRS4_9BACI|nr:RepB family plasmid replication initiator protein [Peribacillus simplex]CEG31423.1 hypothetical protein BN1180_01567 [Peribacillus simplex]